MATMTNWLLSIGTRFEKAMVSLMGEWWTLERWTNNTNALGYLSQSLHCKT
jgi:hypothetical protein